MLKNKAWLIAVVYIIGMSLSIDHIGNKMIVAYIRSGNGGEGAMEAGMYWLAFWSTVASYGVLRGAIQWFVGGWWYNVRLEWCAADLMVGHDKALGRRIYMMNQLIYALPNVAIHLVLTMLYANYFEWLSMSPTVRVGTMLLLGACSLLTVIKSHRMVVTHFEMEKRKTMMWFLILPLLILGMQSLGMAYVMMAL